MGGDVQQPATAASGHAGEQADIDLLDDPGRGCFEVVQEDFRHRVLVQLQGLVLVRHALHRRAPQQSQGLAVLTGYVPQGVENDVLRGQTRTDVVHQQHCRYPHREGLAGRQRLGKVQQVIALPVLQQLHRQGGGRLQQLEGSVVLQPLRTAVVAQEGL